MNYDTYYKYSKRRVKNTKSRLLKLQEKILKETIKIDEELLKRFEDENDLLDDYENDISKLQKDSLVSIPVSIAIVNGNIYFSQTEQIRFLNKEVVK